MDFLGSALAKRRAQAHEDDNSGSSDDDVGSVVSSVVMPYTPAREVGQPINEMNKKPTPSSSAADNKSNPPAKPLPKKPKDPFENAISDPSLPPGWYKLKTTDGKEFYGNKNTEQTSWVRPNADGTIPEAKSVSREPNEADNDKNDDDVQQPAWKSTLRKVEPKDKPKPKPKDSEDERPRMNLLQKKKLEQRQESSAALPVAQSSSSNSLVTAPPAPPPPPGPSASPNKTEPKPKPKTVPAVAKPVPDKDDDDEGLPEDILKEIEREGAAFYNGDDDDAQLDKPKFEEPTTTETPTPIPKPVETQPTEESKPKPSVVTKPTLTRRDTVKELSTTKTASSPPPPAPTTTVTAAQSTTQLNVPEASAAKPPRRRTSFMADFNKDKKTTEIPAAPVAPAPVAPAPVPVSEPAIVPTLTPVARPPPRRTSFLLPDTQRLAVPLHPSLLVDSGSDVESVVTTLRPIDNNVRKLDVIQDGVSRAIDDMREKQCDLERRIQILESTTTEPRPKPSLLDTQLVELLGVVAGLNAQVAGLIESQVRQDDRNDDFDKRLTMLHAHLFGGASGGAKVPELKSPGGPLPPSLSLSTDRSRVQTLEDRLVSLEQLYAILKRDSVRDRERFKFMLGAIASTTGTGEMNLGEMYKSIVEMEERLFDAVSEKIDEEKRQREELAQTMAAQQQPGHDYSESLSALNSLAIDTANAVQSTQQLADEAYRIAIDSHTITDDFYSWRDHIDDEVVPLVCRTHAFSTHAIKILQTYPPSNGDATSWRREIESLRHGYTEPKSLVPMDDYQGLGVGGDGNSEFWLIYKRIRAIEKDLADMKRAFAVTNAEKDHDILRLSNDVGAISGALLSSSSSPPPRISMTKPASSSTISRRPDMNTSTSKFVEHRPLLRVDDRESRAAPKRHQPSKSDTHYLKTK